jgi:hypothetical protein
MMKALNSLEIAQVSGADGCDVLAGVSGGIIGGIAGVAGTAISGPIGGVFLGGLIGGGVAGSVMTICETGTLVYDVDRMIAEHPDVF